jgi:hypothetical protein
MPRRVSTWQSDGRVVKILSATTTACALLFCCNSCATVFASSPANWAESAAGMRPTAKAVTNILITDGVTGGRIVHCKSHNLRMSDFRRTEESAACIGQSPCPSFHVGEVEVIAVGVIVAAPRGIFAIENSRSDNFFSRPYGTIQEHMLTQDCVLG